MLRADQKNNCPPKRRSNSAENDMDREAHVEHPEERDIHHGSDSHDIPQNTWNGCAYASEPLLPCIVQLIEECDALLAVTIAEPDLPARTKEFPVGSPGGGELL